MNTIQILNHPAFASFVTYMQARRFSVHTISRRVSSVGGFARFLTPMDIMQATADDVSSWLATFTSPRTVHSYRSDLSAFYGWAVKRRILTENPVDLVGAVRVPKGVPRPVPILAVPALVNAAPMPLRLGLALAAYAGLRRAEVVALTSDDVQLEPDPLLVVRNGKGGKDRVVPLHPVLVAMLAGRLPQGRLVPMSPDRFGRAAAEHLREHGHDCTVHQLRHSFGTELARALKGNVVATARIMGHESPGTTMGYVGWQGGDVGLAGMYGKAS